MKNPFAFSKNAGIKKIRPDIEKIKSHVRYLSDIRPYRSFANPASLEKSAEYIMREFKKYCNNADYQMFKVAGLDFKNVLCFLGPEDGRRIVLGAHYDVCGDQPGADDNASGIAGLIEILRILSGFEKDLKYRIDFAAYCLEEPPNFKSKNMGSYRHADMLKKSGAPVEGMICLEMIGYFTDRENSQDFPAPGMELIYPTTGNFICVVSNISSAHLGKNLQKYMGAAGIGVERLVSPSIVPGVDFSDHWSFWEFDYHAVMITDTAFYRNENYHHTTDTIDTLDFSRMSEVIKGLAWALLNL
ncbi:MAG: M28 family peptidase [Spirochaetes bacterium]|nr:M28 family peptidase [Spirochaetota bacterium]